MSDVAVRAHGLGKAYKIARNRGRSGYKTLQEDVIGLIKRPFARSQAAEPAQEQFWALRDIDFEIKHGEVVGIIGRNGAGKSTLLKLLSRITKPTTGYADVYGRVGSLLEVGTGFHPELTGRENIYLNGAILGMSRADIRKRFDEIVQFAEVEQFLDTPVKRYSSGMYMRLAFAVAAHLEPEILIVDEVLAVGDAEFQKKSLGKMGDVAKSGRTVLFVSHNMAAVESLCNRGIFLSSGTKILDASVGKVIQKYVNEHVERGLHAYLQKADRLGGTIASFEEVSIHSQKDKNEYPQMADDLSVVTRIYSREKISNVAVCLVIWDERGGRIIDVNTSLKGEFLTFQSGHSYEVIFNLKHVLLRPATYKLELWMGIEHQLQIDYIPSALMFDIAPRTDVQNRGLTDYSGSYRCEFEYNVKSIQQVEVA